MNITVLGCGLVGRPMAVDLASDASFKVTVVDRNPANLKKLPANKQIRAVEADLSKPDQLRKILESSDMVLNAVPGFMGFSVMDEIIAAGKNVVDIAFFPEDPFLLDAKAQQNNVTAVVDCGVAPGMSNLLTGYVDSLLDRTDSVLIYVGGLPVVRTWPYEYKAGFSPADVIEEYTRPARYVENGTLVVRPALSDPELLSFPEIGTLEAFNSDGLRTLAATLKAPNMKEKTLRYPGHIEKMLVLRESGFFSSADIDLNGINIKPIDLTSRLLFPMWELRDGDADITIMKIIIEGVQSGKKIRYTYDLFARHDETNNVHSMARTTGYTATAVVRLIANGLYDTKGISPPEYIGRNNACVDFILKELEQRGIHYHVTIDHPA